MVPTATLYIAFVTKIQLVKRLHRVLMESKMEREEWGEKGFGKGGIKDEWELALKAQQPDVVKRFAES